MAKVTRIELNECIAEAIANVIKEDYVPQSYFDDIIASFEIDNPNRKKSRAEKAFDKETEREEKAKNSDDAKLAAAAAAEEKEKKRLEGDEESAEEDLDDEEGEGYNMSDIRTMGYKDLYYFEKSQKRGTVLQRVARAELAARNRVINDNTDILSGKTESPEAYLSRVKQIATNYWNAVNNKEIYGDYGFMPDDEGYPVRKHEFKPADGSADVVDMENSNGTNFHWLKIPMSARGGVSPKYGGPDIGMTDASWV